MRIAELENQLEELSAAIEPKAVSADEMRAYLKVRAMLGSDYPEGYCGVNECQRIFPRRSLTEMRRLRIDRCVNECSCGPCNIDDIRMALEATRLELEGIASVLSASSARFGRLGK